MKEAWFHSMGFKSDFWGEEWGATLFGILQRRPRFFSGNLEKETYREFKQSSDIERCKESLHHLIALDRLFESLTSKYPLVSARIIEPLLTFQPILFTYWARRQLRQEQGFAPLTREQARIFLNKLRGKTEKPPYRMTRFRKVFFTDLITDTASGEPDKEEQLIKTLELLWKQFVDEYAWVKEEDLDERFSRFILIETCNVETLH
jgi:hypothetical protein